MFNRFTCRNIFGDGIHLLQNPSFVVMRLLSTISDQNQVTVDYLIHSCGLSPESALKASKQIHLKSTAQPDSVLSLLKTYGFAKPEISTIISKRPVLLAANPDKSLKPKLEYFRSMGISDPNIRKFICADTSILLTNLETRIIPAINFLKKFAGTDANVSLILYRSKRLLSMEHVMGPNIAILQNLSVPDSNIVKFLKAYPQTFLHSYERFSEVALHVKKMGVAPSRRGFLHCLRVLFALTKPVWDAKMAVYKSFGMSEDEVLSMFKKQPTIMACSAKKINLALDFLMNRLKWTRGVLANNPNVVSLSLEKRVIPRCFVLQILNSMGFIKMSSMGQALKITDKLFMKKYVLNYQHEVPDLMKLYQGKLGTQGSKIGFDNGCNLDKI